MEWHFKNDNRLLIFPALLLFLALFFFFNKSYQQAFRIIVLAWALFFCGYFYLLHVKKFLGSSVHKLRFHQDNFQILDNKQWLTVELANSSLISSWLLALQWKVTNEEKPFFRKSYSLVVRPGSMEDSEFRGLMRILNQL